MMIVLVCVLIQLCCGVRVEGGDAFGEELMDEDTSQFRWLSIFLYIFRGRATQETPVSVCCLSVCASLTTFVLLCLYCTHSCIFLTLLEN